MKLLNEITFTTCDNFKPISPDIKLKFTRPSFSSYLPSLYSWYVTGIASYCSFIVCICSPKSYSENMMRYVHFCFKKNSHFQFDFWCHHGKPLQENKHLCHLLKYRPSACENFTCSTLSYIILMHCKYSILVL